MGNYKVTFFDSLYKQFHPTTEQIAREDEEGNLSASDEYAALTRKKAKSDETWGLIRDMTLRGNAAGAIAALSFLGSGRFTPRLGIGFAIFSFLLGLLVLFFQRLLGLKIVSNEATVEFNLIYDPYEITHPRQIYKTLSYLFDWLAVIALLTGGFLGIWVIYSAVTLEPKCNSFD